MTRTLIPFALLLTASAAFAAKPQDAYFVRCDRSTLAAAPDGLWVGAPTATDPNATTPSLELEVDATGALTATVHGNLAEMGTIQGWSADGGSALVGVEPDVIGFMGQPLANIGVEPDEIDFMGSCEPQALVGVEPDEIDVEIAVTELGETFELRSDLGAYLVVEAQPQRDGSLVLVPTHVITNANCF